jgi:hypothetical protein
MFYSLFLGHIPGDLNKKKFKPGTDNIVIYNLIKAPKKNVNQLFQFWLIVCGFF